MEKNNQMYALRLRQPVEDATVRSALATALSQRLNTSIDKLEKMLASSASPMTRPLELERAESLASIFQSAGLSVEITPHLDDSLRQNLPLQTTPSIAKPLSTEHEMDSQNLAGEQTQQLDVEEMARMLSKKESVSFRHAIAFTSFCLGAIPFVLDVNSRGWTFAIILQRIALILAPPVIAYSITQQKRYLSIVAYVTLLFLTFILLGLLMMTYFVVAVPNFVYPQAERSRLFTWIPLYGSHVVYIILSLVATVRVVNYFAKAMNLRIFGNPQESVQLPTENISVARALST